jgi:hypothetical protein
MHGEKERLAAPEDPLVEVLSRKLTADGLADAGPAEEEARRFIAVIRDRSGLLQGRGDGTLQFSHRTFQEYLAARHLASLEEDDMIDQVMVHLHEAWWREVHLLLFGHVGSGKEGASKVERLALSILEATPPPWSFLLWSWPLPFRWPRRTLSPGRWFPGWQIDRRIEHSLRRNLAFVVAGYADCAPTARTGALTDRLKAAVEARLSRWRRQPGEIPLDPLIRSAGPAKSDNGVATALHKGLSAALEDDDPSVRRSAAEALGAAAGDPAVAAALLERLADDDWFVRGSAARALGAAAGDPAVAAALLERLADEDRFVRASAAVALGAAAAGDPAVAAVLLERLADGDWFVRSAAAEALAGAPLEDAKIRAQALRILIRQD